MTPSQFIFHRSTIALIGSLFFLWASVGLFHDTSLNNEDLIPHQGIVAYMDSVRTHSGRGGALTGRKSFRLRISLHSEPHILYTATPLSKYGNFSFITARVKVGDQVTLYTKPRLWGIFGLKKAGDISLLTKNDEVIISYERFKQKVRDLPLFMGEAAIGFLLAYIWISRKRLRKSRQPDEMFQTPTAPWCGSVSRIAR